MSDTMRWGDYRVEIIPDTEFGLDGGAMFGVVPRTLWAKPCPPDEFNRIRMNMNCAYIETPQEKILIETGIGDKWSEKLAAIYGIKRERKLTESLQQIAGVAADEITIVVNTHLHFDHAGGNTTRNDAGEIVPTFPNARYFISEREYLHAENPLERDRASYLPENWQPVQASEQLELKPDNYEVAPGLSMETVTGHNKTMQCWRLVANDKNGTPRTLYGFADLIPTRAHVPHAWIMGYDLYPVETLENKQRLLPQAIEENWLGWFYHDPDAPLAQIVEIEGKIKAGDSDLANRLMAE